MTDPASSPAYFVPRGFLGKGEFPAYQRGQNAALALTGALWVFVTASLFALAQTAQRGPLPLTILVGAFVFVAVGWTQASLSNGFHEAVHHNFGRRHSDLVSLLLLGLPTFFTLGYRTVHNRHHRWTGHPENDPDFATYAPFPKTRGEFLARLFWMGSGLAAARQLVTRNLRSSAAGARSAEREPLLGQLVLLAVVQAALVLGFRALFGGPLLSAFAWYVGFWILPLGTVAKLAKSTRGFCEHASPERPWVLRTITGSPWQTGTLGMYGFHFHGEHHIYPWAPYASLSDLHERHRRALAEDRDYAANLGADYEIFEGGYFALLWKWYRELPRRAGAAGPP